MDVVTMVELPKNEKCVACGSKCVGAHWHYGSDTLGFPAGRDGRVRFCTGACCPLDICQELAAKGGDAIEWEDDDEIEWHTEATPNDEDEMDWADVPG